jgi:hypothetical protein
LLHCIKIIKFRNDLFRKTKLRPTIASKPDNRNENLIYEINSSIYLFSTMIL